MADIFTRWPQWFRDRFGGVWPETYLYLDTETTGFDRKLDVIWEWGHCLVKDRKPIDRLRLIIDWTNHPVVKDAWLRNRINRLRQGMEMQGRTSQCSYEKMRDEGMRPEKAFKFIHEFTNDWKSSGMLFAAHGGIFDEEMLDNILDDGFSFGDDGWIDTESIEKASQLPLDPRVQPLREDTLRSYWKRVKYARLAIDGVSVKSNLDTHCFGRYNFPERFGIQKEDLHGAYTDAYAGYCLMESYRSIIHPTTTDVVADLAFGGPTKRGKAAAAKAVEAPAPAPPAATRRYRKQRPN